VDLQNKDKLKGENREAQDKTGFQKFLLATWPRLWGNI